MTACWNCSALNATPIALVRDEETIGIGEMCTRCFAEATAELDVLRLEFEALLSAGVSMEDANTIMIAKIEGRQVIA